LAPVQTSIDHSLDYVEGQQRELEGVLDKYEAEVAEILGEPVPLEMQYQRGLGVGAGADAEREKACVFSLLFPPFADRRTEALFPWNRYTLAESLNTQLDSMSRSLSSLISEVNSLGHPDGGSSAEAAGGVGGGGDAVGQIAAILNAHLNSLQWLENATDSLKGQVEEMEQRVKGASEGSWKGLSRSQLGGGAKTASRGFLRGSGNWR
jgi:nuclear pore complex protein Nup62